MKLQLALLMFCFSGFASAQVLNRVYLNADVGIPKHSDVGLVVHVFKHFSVAGYVGLTNVKNGKATVSLYGLPLYRKYPLKNTYKSKYLLFGFTTRSFHKFNYSFMFGPSWTDAVELKSTEYYDIYSHTMQVKYYKVYSQGVGCAFRADAILEVSNFFGFNAGIQYNLNPVRSEWTIQLGINLGIVMDKSDKKWIEPRTRERVIIDRSGSYK